MKNLNWLQPVKVEVFVNLKVRNGIFGEIKDGKKSSSRIRIEVRKRILPSQKRMGKTQERSPLLR
jgi:hypothetical protein